MAVDLVCDGCGAMLPSPDSAGLSHCMSCGRVNHVELDPREPEPASSSSIPPATWLPDERAPQVVWQTTTADTRTGPAAVAAKRKRGRSWLGCLPLLVVLVVGVAVGGGAIFSAVDQGTNGALSGNRALNLYPSSGSVLVLPGEPSSGVDLLAVVTDNDDDSARKVARVRIGDDAAETVLWKSAALPSDVYSASYALDGDTVYVGVGTEVRALSLATGDQASAVTLSDKVSTSCPATCFVVLDGTLVVRTDDAYVTGYRAGSTEPRWSYRLRSTAGQFSVVGDQLLVVDDAEVAGDPSRALRLDPATGTVGGTATPECGERDEDPYIPFGIDLDPDTAIRAVPGTGDAVAMFGSGYSCVARWEIATGTIRWAVPIESGASMDDESEPVLTATDLVFGIQTETSAGIRIDLATGARTDLAPIADATAVPRAVVGTTLIGETVTTRGTTRGGLAGWDLATGARLWSTTLPGQTEPVTQDRYRSSDTLFDDEARTLIVSGTPVRLVTFSSTRQVSVQTVDVATGELGAKVTGTLPSRYSSSGSASLTVEAFRADRVVVSIDSLLAAVDLTGTGTLDVQRWPPS